MHTYNILILGLTYLDRNPFVNSIDVNMRRVYVSHDKSNQNGRDIKEE